MQDAVPQDQVRIGARLVVELLRINAEEPVTDKIRLTPQRTRHAQAVLNDYLAKIQSSLLHTDTRSRVSDALVDQCSELQIALPIAAPDWGGILLLDALFDQLQTQRAMDAEAGAWFACLRLLTVRYALADYSFFFAPQNLLRRFLNQAYLTLLSSTAKSRTLYWDKLNQYAKRMLDGFQGNVAVVNSICIEAQAWMAGQSEKVEQIEERLRLLEVTKRKEKVAEPRVVQEFNRIAAGRHLPPEAPARPDQAARRHREYPPSARCVARPHHKSPARPREARRAVRSALPRQAGSQGRARQVSAICGFAP